MGILWPSKPQTPYSLTPDGSLPFEYQTVLASDRKEKLISPGRDILALMSEIYNAKVLLQEISRH
jgi:hypothetical protein